MQAKADDDQSTWLAQIVSAQLSRPLPLSVSLSLGLPIRCGETGPEGWPVGTRSGGGGGASAHGKTRERKGAGRENLLFEAPDPRSMASRPVASMALTMAEGAAVDGKQIAVSRDPQP